MLSHCLVELFGQNLIQHVFANLIGVLALDDAFRSFAGAETWDAGIFLIVPRDAAESLGYIFGGNVQHYFAGAVRIQDGAMVVVVMLVIVCMAFVASRFLLRCVFEGVNRTQLCCLPGAFGAA